MRDALQATVVMLKASAAVLALADTRVYGEELPEGEASAEPRAVVLVRRVPGAPRVGGFLALQEDHFGVWCLGENPYRAMELHLATADALKHARRQVQEDTLLHGFDPLSGPEPGVDPDTQWPYVFSTWRCLAGEEQAV